MKLESGKEEMEKILTPERLEEIKDLILTPLEYRESPYAKNESQSPYTYKIVSGVKELVFIGVMHTYDANDPLFDEIKEAFTNEQPEIVYIEGWEAINSRKEEVRKMLKAESYDEGKLNGESHFTLKLGVEAGIDFESPEPKYKEEISHLVETGFSKRDIFKFYMYRQVGQYQSQHPEGTSEDCIQYLGKYLDSFARASSWDSKELEEFAKALFDEVDVTDDELYRRSSDPIPWEGAPQSVLNEIARASSRFRDRFMVGRIAKGFKTHNKLFVVYGSGHAVTQEPALRILINSV